MYQIFHSIYQYGDRARLQRAFNQPGGRSCVPSSSSNTAARTCWRSRSVPSPSRKPGHVVIEVKAFGLNHAEIYFRQGVWGDVAEISGIECVGAGEGRSGRAVRARARRSWRWWAAWGAASTAATPNWSACRPATSSPSRRDLPWDAARGDPGILRHRLDRALTATWRSSAGQTIVIRGATSALGQAAVNIAAHAGARVIATTRNAERAAMLEALGAKRGPARSAGALASASASATRKASTPCSTSSATARSLDSLAMVRPRRPGLPGRLPRRRRSDLGARAGVADAERRAAQRLRQRLRHRHAGISAVGDSVPGHRRSRRRRRLQGEAGAGSFASTRSRQAHRLMESNEANGKIVVTI